MQPPQSEAELVARANTIAGLSLEQLTHQQAIPANLRRDKGWVGQFLEQLLGATASNLAEPDFQHLGIELKTIPVNANGQPRESTYVCTAPLLNLRKQIWQTSTVRKKLARVLWVPIEADPQIPLAKRRIGAPLLWSPTSQQAQILQSDWEELTELICLGQLNILSARQGTYLQIRPKAAHSRSICDGISETGDTIKTLPRGFYLRVKFTAQILKAHYAANI